LNANLRDPDLDRIGTPRDAARMAFRRYRDRIAFFGPRGETVSFGTLGTRVFGLARGLLESGLQPGDRVAFLLPNSIEFVELRLACHEAGLVAVPLIWDLTPEARAAALQAAAPGLYVYDPQLDAGPPAGEFRTVAVPRGERGGLEELIRSDADESSARVAGDSPATINFTSGTTGTPKGVVSTHSSWATSLKMTAKSGLLSAGEGELFLHAIPLATAGWGTVLPCMLGGIGGLLMPEWNPGAALDLAGSREVTGTLLTPSMLIDWLDEPDLDGRLPPSLRAIICGTAPLHGPKAAEALQAFGPVLYQGYGLAEVLPPLASMGPAAHDPERFPLRVGRTAGGVDVRIVDARGARLEAGTCGQIEVRSPTQTPGYWLRPDLTAAAVRGGFFRTGDLGFVDEDGFLNVLGRASEVPPGISGHPRTVEEAAHRHAALKECALVATEEGTTLFCSVRRGRELSPGELDSTVAEQLPARSRPQSVRVVAGDLPRSAAGKLARTRLPRLPVDREP